MRRDPRSSNETASVISLKYNNDENLATLLSNTTTEKRSIPELTPLTCWTAKLLFRADAEYPSVKESLIEVNWSEACRLPAQCTISPTSAEEVSLAMKVISFLQVPFAVRSGGHSSNPYWSSIGFNGILISTTNLDSLAVSSDSSIASIGPGLRRGAVYEALDPYGVSVIGGRTPQVGVGGLILGGGLSYFSAQYGLAADNAKNFDSTCQSCSSGDGLFSQLASYTIPIRNIWFQATAYSLTELPNVLAAFIECQKNGAQTDPKTSVLINILNTGCSMGLVYSEPAIYPDAFTPFAAIPNGIARVPAANATVSLLSTILGSALSNLHVYRSAASLIDETLYNETSSYYFDTINGLQADGVNKIPPSLATASKARGGNPMGVPLQAHQWWTTITNWASVDDDNAVLDAVKSIGDQFETLGAARDTNLSYLYMNDCYADQNPLAQYPPASIKAMKEIAAKYDLIRVFQLLQKGFGFGGKF